MDVSVWRQELLHSAHAALSICLTQVPRDDREIVAGVTVVNIGA